MSTFKKIATATTLVAGLGLSSMASAIEITATDNGSDLINALFGGAGSGVDMGTVSITVNGQTSGSAASAGTYTNASNTYGIGAGMVISSGDVNDYNDGPNNGTGNTTGYGVGATASQEALLDPITGGSLNHFDVTQIDISFNLLDGFDSVFFNVVFGSDEFDEYVGSSYIDAFGLFVNGTNVAFADGSPINIDHPNMEFVSGTELDGILGGSQGDFGSYVHTFGTFVGNAATVNLTFIIADSGDSSLDSVAYISQLGGTPPTPVPAPSALLLLGLGLAGFGVARRK